MKGLWRFEKEKIKAKAKKNYQITKLINQYIIEYIYRIDTIQIIFKSWIKKSKKKNVDFNWIVTQTEREWETDRKSEKKRAEKKFFQNKKFIIHVICCYYWIISNYKNNIIFKCIKMVAYVVWKFTHKRYVFFCFVL